MVKSEKANENNTGFASTFDKLLPPEMAAKARTLGIKKAHLDFLSTFALAVLAGAFIALGCIFFTVSQTTGGVAIPWGIIYVGNLCGALATALVVFWGQHYKMDNGALGLTALNIGLGKVNLGFVQAIILGILCNAMVCMAIWLTYSARTVLGRVTAIIFPIAGFVAAGFEHCVANMYFIPYAILVKVGAPESFWQSIGTTPASYSHLTWGAFFVRNLIPVTIGNMIGGVFFVALVYWIIYLRKGSKTD
jgi:formate/nitrite transporter